MKGRPYQFHACRYRGCRLEATCMPRLYVPPSQFSPDRSKDVSALMGMPLCEAHFKMMTPAELLQGEQGAAIRDQIVKALRGLGYDIDRITVQQAPHSSAMAAGGEGRGGSFAAPDQRSAGERQGQSFRQDTGQRQNETRSAAALGGDLGDSGGGVVI